MISLAKNVINSSFWMLTISFFQRLIGLISTLILARLLTPDDFGIVAVATLILYFFEKFSNTGTNIYILQKDVVSDADLNTAWTIDVILKLIVWFILILSAPFIAEFYEAPKLENVVVVFSFILLIRGFTNPGLLLLRKNFQYKKIFNVSVLQKVLSFITAITIAINYRSYWAMIAGEIVFFSVLLISSYAIHHHRPSFTLLKAREQWKFSKWVLGKGFIGFIKGQLDTLIISKLFSAAELGKYHVNRNLATMPSQQVIIPALEPIISAISKSKNDDHAFAYQFNLCVFTLILIIFPMSTFMWFFPEPIVLVLLGDQWKDTSPLLAALSILVSAFCLSHLVHTCFLALGKTKTLFFYDVVSLVLIGTILLSLSNPTLEIFAMIRGGMEFILLITLVIWLAYLRPLKMARLTLLVLLVFIASFVPAWLIKEFLPISFDLKFVELIALTGIYAISYLIFLGVTFCLYAHRTPEGNRILSIIGAAGYNVRSKLKYTFYNLKHKS